MLAALKQRMEEKKARAKAIAESRQWRTNPLLQDCLQAMRGTCTVLPMDLHEAAETAVNIALREDIWTEVPELIDIPDTFLGETVYIIWDEATLPVLKAPWVMVDKNLHDIRCVCHHTFLVAETLDRIIWFDGLGRIKLSSIA